MTRVWIGAALVLALAGMTNAVTAKEEAAVATTIAVDSTQQTAPQQAPAPAQPKAWYASPIWIAIGGVSLVLVILLIVLAAKGEGTTVVRD